MKLRKTTSTKTNPKPYRRFSVARFAVLGVVAVGIGSLGYQFIQQSRAAVPATQSGLVGAITNVPGAAIYRYGTTDNQGTPMTFAKVLPSPAGGYLAVYAGSNVVKVATSSDLKNWTYRADLDSPATWSNVASDGGSGFVVADVFNQGTYPNIKTLHYASVNALYGGQADASYVLPRQQSQKCPEIGPGIISASGNSSAQITFSYDTDSDCDTFRVGVGTMSGYSSWNSSKNTSVDNAIISAASGIGKKVNGSITYRDVVRYGGGVYGLLDAQYTEKNNATWNIYLLNTSSQAQVLPIKTHRGSSSFAGPSATVAKGPDGSTGLIVSMVVQPDAAAAGEAGELIYYVRTSDPPKAAAPAPAPKPSPAPVAKSSGSSGSSGGSSYGSLSSSGVTAAKSNELDVSSQNNGAYQGSNVNLQDGGSSSLGDDIVGSGGQTGDQKAVGTTTAETTKSPFSSPWVLVVFAALFLGGLGLFLFIRVRQQRLGYAGYGTDSYDLPEDEIDVYGAAEELGFGPTGYVGPFSNSQAPTGPAKPAPVKSVAPVRTGTGTNSATIRPAKQAGYPQAAAAPTPNLGQAGTNYQPPKR